METRGFLFTHRAANQRPGFESRDRDLAAEHCELSKEATWLTKSQPHKMLRPQWNGYMISR